MQSLSRFFCCLLIFLTACTTVPHTGRSALHLMDNEELVNSAAMSFTFLKQETPISTDPTYNAMLTRVGSRIAAVAEPYMPGATDWEFVVFDDDATINAFAMAGGKIAVYTGLFKVAKTDDQLAVVVGHEVAHVVAGHSNERASQQMLAAGGALALGVGTAFTDLSSAERAAILAAYGAGSTVGVILPYSRTHEFEADEIGLLYMAKAGYNPMEAVTFWEGMMAQGGAKPPEFLSTHPADHRRINQIKIQLPEVMPLYRAAKR
ncbi:MAG: M48 family metallopeptidase [Coraliomargarita sp.]